MNKYFDVITRALELAETSLAGLEHCKDSLNQGKVENAAPLLEDVLAAYAKIEEALQPVLPSLEENKISQFTDTLRSSFDLVVSAIEQGEGAKSQEVIQFNLLPSYKAWLSELNRILKPYVVS